MDKENMSVSLLAMFVPFKDITPVKEQTWRQKRGKKSQEMNGHSSSKGSDTASKINDITPVKERTY